MFFMWNRKSQDRFKNLKIINNQTSAAPQRLLRVATNTDHVRVPADAKPQRERKHAEDQARQGVTSGPKQAINSWLEEKKKKKGTWLL